MKGWMLPIGIVLGLGGFVAVLVWSPFGGPAGELTHGEVLSSGLPAASPGLPLHPEGDLPLTRRKTVPPRTASTLAASHLDSLFAALAIHRPVDRPEAPEFQLPDVEGRPVQLRDLRGKLVFLNFWATWCPPCRLEMPSMERLYQTFKQTEFAMLAVSIDRQGIDVVKPFVEDLKLTFPILLDRTMEVAREYGLRGMPTTYLIDQDGRLIGAAVGSREWSSVEAKALIASLLQYASATGNDPVQ